MMKKLKVICVFPVLLFGCDSTKNKTAGPENNSAKLRHSSEWISKSLLNMHAVDDAYIIEFGIGDAGGSETAYDRQMQVIRAFALGWASTGNKKYLDHINDTLDDMKKPMARKYPVGINYIYIPDTTANSRNQNTWCHMWGLKGFIALLQLQNSFNKTNTIKK